MKIRIDSKLPYATASLIHNGKQLVLNNVILDTGSGGSVFKVNKVADIGLQLEPNDIIKKISGIGGSEFVYIKRVDKLSIGDLEVNNFEIEIGAMDYNFDIDGIIGIDFLIQTGALLDFDKLEIRKTFN